MTDREDKIRQRAYGIWEEEGYPHGRAEDHWHRALREVEVPAAEAGAAEPASPDIGSTAGHEPAGEALAEKAVPRRRKAAGAAAATPRKRTVKKG